MIKNKNRFFKCFFTIFLGALLVLSVVSCKDETGDEPKPTPVPSPESTPEPSPTGHNGYALAIGLNKVDPAHYAGWDGALTGCEPDVDEMEKIAKEEGLKVETLKTTQATRAAVIGKITDYAGKLKSGDLLVVSYSGHGGQIPDHNGDETVDNMDETWCLYDGEILDDELYELWGKFAEGVRILVLSDSCHSGTVLKMRKTDWGTKESVEKFNNDWKKHMELKNLDKPKVRDTRRNLLTGEKPTVTERAAAVEEETLVFHTRSIPPLESFKTYNENLQFYQEIGSRAPKENPDAIKAAMILISGCEDQQTSADLGFAGLFTWNLVKVWNKGSFQGDHDNFHQKIKEAVLAMNSTQSPNLFKLGKPEAVDKFSKQRPFNIEK